MDPNEGKRLRSEDELREEDVTAGDRLDDRVSESEGLPDGPTELPEVDDRP